MGVSERFTWSHVSPNCDNNCDCYEKAAAAARAREALKQMTKKDRAARDVRRPRSPRR